MHTGDALSHQRWIAARPSSLRCFAGAQPGAFSAVPTTGLPSLMERREPELAELANAEPHFAVLTVVVQRLEWLHLHTRGQRRASFVWAGGAGEGTCDMQWLNP